MINLAMSSFMLRAICISIFFNLVWLVNVRAHDLRPLRWDQLRKFRIEKHEIPPELEAINGKKIEILGFIVPFEDGKDAAAEFLLVPSSQVCIHVPPPPSNQIIWVRMKQGTSIPLKITPLYVSGKFRIMTNDSPVGKVGFYLEGDRVSETPLIK